jgi:Cytochrome P450
MHWATYVAVAAFIVGWMLYYIYQFDKTDKKNRAEGKVLPGPKNYPFVGRVHDLPVEYMWLKFKEWADKYGPIYYTSMFGSEFIIISDEAIAEEMLVKRAKYNSDRPMMRSVTDSKSSEGGMEYLPLMGKNRKRNSLFLIAYLLTKLSRVLGSSASLRSLISYRSE